jgi:ketosteroid isomerase-like protein
MSIEGNKAIMRRMIEEIWNQGRLEVADELFAPDATSPGLPLPPGPEGVKLVAGMFLRAFPDLHMEIEDIIAEGDRVVGRFTETATHQGEFMGVPATGKPVKFTEMGILRIRDGQIVESWYNLDQFGLMQQLGAIPGPGGG